MCCRIFLEKGIHCLVQICRIVCKLARVTWSETYHATSYHGTAVTYRHTNVYGKESNAQVRRSLKTRSVCSTHIHGYIEATFSNSKDHWGFDRLIGLQVIFIIVPVMTKTLLRKLGIWHEIEPVRNYEILVRERCPASIKSCIPPESKRAG